MSICSDQTPGSDIQAAHVAIGVHVGSTGPDGFPTALPGQIAALYQDLHALRGQAERVFTG